jgi:hypothetical protein
MFFDAFFKNYKSFFLKCDEKVKRALFAMGDRTRFQDVIMYHKLNEMKCKFDKIIFDEHFVYENGQMTSLIGDPILPHDYYFVRNMFLI